MDGGQTVVSTEVDLENGARYTALLRHQYNKIRGDSSIYHVGVDPVYVVVAWSLSLSGGCTPSRHLRPSSGREHTVI